VRSIKRLLPDVAMLVVALGVAPTAVAQSDTRFAADLEMGPVWQSRNDVRIPNTAAGTRFSLVDVVGQGPWPAGRLYITWNITNRHSIRGLLAPLSYTATGTRSGNKDFSSALAWLRARA